MAEADEGVDTGEAPEHADTSGPPPAPDATSSSAAAETGRSEWTASDARGPLVGADGVTELTDQSPTEPVAPAMSAASPAEATSEPAAPPAPVRERRASYWPVAAGLVVGAAVGAAIALWVYPSVQPQSAHDPDVPALSAKVAALEARPNSDAAIAALESKIARLQTTVAGLPKAATAAAPTAGLVPNPGSAPAPAPANNPQPAPVAFDPTPLNHKIAELATEIDALKTQTAGGKETATQVTAMATTVADLQKQAETSATSLQSVQDQQKSLEGKVGTPALAVVAASLVQQIDLGQPYALQIDALSSLGADPVKVGLLKPNAQAGVSSAKVLASQFAPLEEPILATEHKAPAGAGFVDRMKSGLSSLITVRRADDVSGSDLSSRVGRIEAALAHDDLADALAAWMALPADAKAKSDAWGALVKTSADAQSAARALQSDAISAMGGKKS